MAQHPATAKWAASSACRARSTDAAKMRADSCGLRKPVLFSDEMKSQRNWPSRCVAGPGQAALRSRQRRGQPRSHQWRPAVPPQQRRQGRSASGEWALCFSLKPPYHLNLPLLRVPDFYVTGGTIEFLFHARAMDQTYERLMAGHTIALDYLGR